MVFYFIASFSPGTWSGHSRNGRMQNGSRSKDFFIEWNQWHACKNVFVTDGACMTSTGNQSPSRLDKALTARAANYAVEEMKNGNL